MKYTHYKHTSTNPIKLLSKGFFVSVHLNKEKAAISELCLLLEQYVDIEKTLVDNPSGGDIEDKFSEEILLLKSTRDANFNPFDLGVPCCVFIQVKKKKENENNFLFYSVVVQLILLNLFRNS